MKLERLTLRNYRNVEESTLVASPHLNFLVGPNGQGKTSFIEAIGYLATLRSFRGSKVDEVVRWGQEQGEILATASPEADGDKMWKVDLKISFQGRSTKVAFINGKPFRSSTSYLSQRFGEVELGFHAVVFNPSDHDLVRGEPATRRTYLDRVLSAEDLDYLKLLQKYQKSLEQRNALLKGDAPPSADLLAGFSEPLVKLGAQLARRRLLWIERVRERLSDVSRQIAPSQPLLSLIYCSNWVPKIQNLSCPSKDLESVHFAGQEGVPSLEILEQLFWNQLSALREAEWRAGSSLIGPHRDDWVFLLGGQPLKGHGSQGEVRSALLSLKLCEIELFRKATGHRPLMLLDDFSSELDRERRAFLLNFLKRSDLQVFVTSTEDSLGLGQKFQVSNGAIALQGDQAEVTQS